MTGLLHDIVEFLTTLYKHTNFQLDKSVARQTSLQAAIDSLPKGLLFPNFVIIITLKFVRLLNKN